MRMSFGYGFAAARPVAGAEAQARLLDVPALHWQGSRVWPFRPEDSDLCQK